MIFWILVAALSALVTYWVTRPLLARQTSATPVGAGAADIAVYKDQLIEIDADLARGQISAAEAEAARAEVSRRLLRAGSDAAGTANTAPARAQLSRVHMAATAALPLVSLGLYLVYGSPDLPGLPLKERMAAAPERSSADELVAKVEARLREEPDDGKGWDILAPVYVAQGRFAEAVDAFANAMRILGETPRRLEGLAMADIRASDGLVTERARKAFERSLALEPKRIEPRLWLAFAQEQDGDLAGAAASYKALIAEAPADASWRKAVEERLAGVEAKASGKAPPAPEQAANAIANLPAEQREMIDKMVAGLASRLKENGNDLEGWLKLMRALKVLGRDSEAASALTDARKQFSGDGKALEAIDGLAKTLGLAS